MEHFKHDCDHSRASCGHNGCRPREELLYNTGGAEPLWNPRAHQKEERKRQANFLHRQMRKYVSAFLATNDNNDALILLGDFNAGLNASHRRHPSQGQAKEFDAMFKACTDWMKNVGLRSAEEVFLVDHDSPVWSYTRPAEEGRASSASRFVSN